MKRFAIGAALLFALAVFACPAGAMPLVSSREAIAIAIKHCASYSHGRNEGDPNRWTVTLKQGLWLASFKPSPAGHEEDIEYLGMTVKIDAHNGKARKCVVSVFDRNL